MKVNTDSMFIGFEQESSEEFISDSNEYDADDVVVTSFSECDLNISYQANKFNNKSLDNKYCYSLPQSIRAPPASLKI